MLFSSCQQPTPSTEATNTAKALLPDTVQRWYPPPPDPREQRTYERFNRAEAAARLAHKIRDGQPLVVHIMVPLCDNDNQGIVPVPKRLGNGLNLKDNLYWGALYGVKTHFRKSKDWRLVSSQIYPDSTVLERVVFFRQYSIQAKVYLVADAYRGDQMQDCVYDVLGAVAGAIKRTMAMEETELGLYGNADLLVFNGHNGILDFEPSYIYTKDNRVRDVAVIGCVSYRYFEDYLLRARGYPLLTTSNLMAPEAYVASALIDAWATGQPDANIRQAAGQAYHNYQKCGLRGATNLFYSGWQDME
ncbi:MAG: hypothetical protein AAF597_00680 [Bacteroidota bacterium]